MTTLSLAHCSICSSVMAVSRSRAVNDSSPEEPRKSMIFWASASDMPSTDTSCDLVPRFRDTPPNLARGLRCIMSHEDDPVAIVACHNTRQCHNHQEIHNVSSASMTGNRDTPNQPCLMYPKNPTWQISQMHITINPVLHKKLVVQIQWQNLHQKHHTDQWVNSHENAKLNIWGVKELIP